MISSTSKTRGISYVDTAANVTLLLSIAYVYIFSLIGIFRTLISREPVSFSESLQLVEAWRAARGMRVYEPLATGHATHMYGPLLSYIFGFVVWLAGPKVLYLRLLSLASALLAWMVALLAVCKTRRAAMVGMAMLLAADGVSGSSAAHARPEYLAILLALAGLMLLFRSRRFVSYAAACVLIVCATLVKQPAALAALIPPVAAAIEHRSARAVLHALTPLACVLIALLITLAAFPDVRFYMFTIPSQYRILGGQFVMLLIGLITWALPLLVIVRSNHARSSKWAWLVAGVLVTVPLTLITAAKAGGAFNSLLPACFAISMLAMYTLSTNWPNAPTRLALAITIFTSGSGLFGMAGWRPDRHDYASVVDAVSQLPVDKVIAPEDPTIILFAGGMPGRNIYAEYDNDIRAWANSKNPIVVEDELRCAQYVVDVVGRWQDLLRPEHLRARGFVEYQRFPHHTIWIRKAVLQIGPRPQCRDG